MAGQRPTAYENRHAIHSQLVPWSVPSAAAAGSYPVLVADRDLVIEEINGVAHTNCSADETLQFWMSAPAVAATAGTAVTEDIDLRLTGTGNMPAVATPFKMPLVPNDVSSATSDLSSDDDSFTAVPTQNILPRGYTLWATISGTATALVGLGGTVVVSSVKH